MTITATLRVQRLTAERVEVTDIRAPHGTDWLPGETLVEASNDTITLTFVAPRTGPDYDLGDLIDVTIAPAAPR